MSQKEKKNVFEESTEILAWIQIFLSPFLISMVISGLIYFSNPSKFTLVIAILIILIGILIGVRFATKKYKSKEGTVHFLSKISSSPELDEEIKRDDIDLKP